MKGLENMNNQLLTQALPPVRCSRHPETILDNVSTGMDSSRYVVTCPICEKHAFDQGMNRGIEKAEEMILQSMAGGGQ